MPELPEVETTKKSLQPLIGKNVADVAISQPQLRWRMPDDLNKLVGQSLDTIERRAKYLILKFSQDDLIIHLGMSGSLQQRALDTQPLKHDHLIIQMQQTSEITKLCYHDPRRFGAVVWHTDYANKLFDHLAPEPLSDDFDLAYLTKTLKKTSRPIKNVIMDQTCVVGVGNIYATECLFLSGIHPLKPSNKVSKAKTKLLLTHIKAVLEKAIELGGSTLRDFTVANGKTGYFQQTLLVYGRAGEACYQCGDVLTNIKISGRASVFCGRCQPK